MREGRIQAADMRERVSAAFNEAFPDQEFEVRLVPVDDVVFTLPAAAVTPAAQVLAETLGIVHLSTITGDDMGDHIRLLYHFWDRCGVTLEVKLPYTEPRIATLTDLIPGALFYEREVYEMFGVTFEGHPNLRPLLLPDEWDGAPPLLRSSNNETEPQA
jgi:NADH:ubiquinone oxidoreductase subunit C